MKRHFYLLLLSFATSMSTCVALAKSGPPAGFHLDVLTDEVPNARQMAQTDSGILFVGTQQAGDVYAVVPAADGAAPEVVTIASGLRMPSGLVLLDGDLYVGALNQILRYDDIEQTFRTKPTAVVVTDNLPDRRMHGWKYLSVGPDGYLYVPVGAPCNVCLSDDERFASILRMDPKTGATEIYARGIRNTVGLAWHPESDELWFSDNGRDMLGDDVPPEEINRVVKPGSHFGYPYVHAGTIEDPEFGAGHSPDDYVGPEVRIQAHSAALGLTFYTGDAFGEDYRGALFVAEHGSWNRSAKVGYRVSVVQFEGEEPTYRPFIDQWLDGQEVSGRPNDVLVARDGSLLISDDQAGAIYRVTYDGG